LYTNVYWSRDNSTVKVKSVITSLESAEKPIGGGGYLMNHDSPHSEVSFRAKVNSTLLNEDGEAAIVVMISMLQASSSSPNEVAEERRGNGFEQSSGHSYDLAYSQN